MWRSTLTLLRKIVVPSLKENLQQSKTLFSTKSRPRSTVRLTLISAGIGVLVGAGYGGYTHYKINAKKRTLPQENEEYAFLKQAPKYTPQYCVRGKLLILIIVFKLHKIKVPTNEKKKIAIFNIIIYFQSRKKMFLVT